MIHCEDECFANRKRYQQLFEEMLSGLALHEIICDDQGNPCDYRFLEVNPAFEKLTGLKRQNIIGKTVRQIMPNTEDYWIEIYGKVALTGYEAHFENFSQELNRHYEVTAYCPEPGKFATIFLDITERKRSLQEIENSEHKYRALFEHAGDGIFIIDTKTDMIVDANPEICRILGYVREEIIGKHHTQLHPEDEYHRALELQQESETSGGFTNVEDTHYLHKDGTKVPVSLTATVIATPPSPIVLVSVRDISDRRKHEQEREELLKTLELKNQEFQSVLYVTSHDLRAPLVNVQGFTKELFHANRDIREILKKLEVDPKTKSKLDYLLDHDIPEASDYIRTSVIKMQALLAGLLQVSRAGTAKLNIKTVDANEQIKQVIQSMTYQIQQNNIQVKVGDLPRCRADAAQFNRVMSNLLDNAVKYADTEKTGRIEIRGEAGDGKVFYYISDNGIGIAEGETDRIFEMFYRSRPQALCPGEGLGLTIVKRIIERMDGKITLVSQSGQGTTFTITLPNP